MRGGSVLSMLALSAAAWGGDLDHLEPRIVNAPAISKTGARFALLAFGPEGKIKAWLILDGEAAYFDRNGNGDLTEPDERVEASKLPAPEGTASLSFKLGEFAFAGERTRYEALLLHRVDKEGQEADSITMRIGDNLLQDVGGFGGGFALSRRAEEAPAVHFSGPLTIALRSDFGGELQYGLPLSDNDIFKPLIPAGAAADRLGLIIVHVGTPGKLASAFVANQYGGIKDGLAPVADLEFSDREPGRPPIRVKAVLSGHSCADGFMGVFEFPKGAAEGPARMTLSFPAWEDSWATDAMRASKVAPATTNVRVSRAKPEP